MQEKTATAPCLTMRGISKSFGRIQALSNVDLDVFAGEIHALMGENGAGKSTLMKILSGAYQPNPGAEIRIDGKRAQSLDPAQAKDLGVAVIYQEIVLAPNLTVAENVFLGREVAAGPRIDRAAMRRACAPVLERLGAEFGPDTIVGELSIAEQQLVEIAKALLADARVLVMDEPTTALSSRETDRLFELVRRLRQDGLAIIYISHRMDEIYALADRCSVLRDGASVGTLTRAELSAERLVKMMVGRDLSSFYKKEHRFSDGEAPVMLSVRGLGDGRRVRDCSFEVRQGEVLGVAGLVGSGRTELARLIYGADRAETGEMWLDGNAFAPRRPQDAIAAGLVYLTEDRKGDGLILDMSVSENVNLNVIEQDAGRFGIRAIRRGRKRADEAIAALSIRVGSRETATGALSGGNQQKVLLARLLATSPKVLILDEPTRGVDIGAKAEIYRIIDELAQQGAAIVLISSELPEIIGTADRVLVMREGRIAGEVGGTPGAEISQETIIELGTGADASPRAQAQH